MKISSIAAIPHKSRNYRNILNLAYNLNLNNKKLPSVNEINDKTLTQQYTMYKLDNVIPRIIQSMAMSPDNGIPILFSKIDLKDRYWIMCVSKKDAWNFVHVFPHTKTDKDY